MNLTPEPTPMKKINRALHTFFVRGFRSAFFLRVSATDLHIGPLALLVMVILTTVASILMSRTVIAGPAEFYPKAILWGWLITILLIWICWYLTDCAKRQGRNTQAASLFALGVGQVFTLDVISTLAYLLFIQPQGLDGSNWHWALYIGMSAWGALAYWLLLTRVTQSRGRLIVLAGIFAIGMPLLVHFSQAPMFWLPQQTDNAEVENSLQLTQEKLETQLQLAIKQRTALKPERPGVIDLFSITYAPYGEEAVFLRESSMVNAVIEERFDAAGHMQELVNHPATLENLPWASLENLERAINRAADIMDREHDILFIYLTSHGAKDGELSASLWPLETDPLTPQTLNLWLDKAGIKNRIIAVSACFSGSWIEPLKTPNTLIMTAADSTHTSYGCGSRSELTFFGQAVFDEGLRNTYSFEEAFRQALPKIRQREQEAGKDDGFSNPQIYLGDGIRPLLKELAKER
ncbi:C13 family peptidase [Methylobacillus caricis]|uniref:C13 family peptidase n=1 Tax=Methylobacillus caricis TaxID=1971611 RepID=UPI001CFFFD86|nr:C13 family peptidase [Methylobacillus caricis]MCB5186605.1 C13 family peptidase [Methylobacillus caricis]